jgi:hypothetical protein
MNTIYADVILFDNIGMVYNGNTLHTEGMGGSEFQVILLLEELAKMGKSVICLNNTKEQLKINNVMYLPHTNINQYEFKCKNLIIHRSSDIPKIAHRKAFLWVTDLNGPHNLKFYNLFEQNKLELICLSEFQASLFPSTWTKHVIYFMIPEWVYDYEIPKEKSGYVYASSLMKGYGGTLEYWKYLKSQNLLNGKQLNVCLPGYDNPSSDISMPIYDINYLNTLPFKEVVSTIANCEGMFYVNIMPETFGISVVLAEILQTTPYVLGLNGLGSLREVLNGSTITTDMKTFVDYFKKEKPQPTKPRQFKSEMVMKRWKKILAN